MMTMFAHSTRIAFSTIAAVAVVSFGGLALDQGHIAAAPRGSIEVGELTPVNPAQFASVALPEVAVHGRRGAAVPSHLTVTTQLPEIVVVARRLVTLVAQPSSAADSTPSATVRGSAEGALLK